MFLLPFVLLKVEGLSQVESKTLSGSEPGLGFTAGVLK